MIWGDPLLSGTVSMLAYGLAAFLAFRLARRTTQDDRALWLICAWVLLFQVFNTHLDLQAFPGSLGRCMARAQGWYQHRALAQVLAFGIVATLSGLVFLWLMVRYHTALWANILLSFGMAISFGFTLLRGVSLHAFESFYSRKLGTIPLSVIIEMTGVAVVIIAAAIRLKSSKNQPIYE